jgi:phosphoribosylformimino-5-aminoimidazole carboxamide ribotide isomerase
VEVIPAIDLRDGRCVRLIQGKFDCEAVYSDNPPHVAARFKRMGARRLHIVDLDGAQKGKLCHLTMISNIREVFGKGVQVGGGIRSQEVVEELFHIGVERVILGTAAVEDSLSLRKICSSYPDAIIVSLDAWGEFISIRGWQEKTSLSIYDLIPRMENLGVGRFIYTDISRDGMLSEPNFRTIENILQFTTLPIIVAGGISSLKQIRTLSQLGVEGVIVGRAIYTGNINLEEVIHELR